MTAPARADIVAHAARLTGGWQFIQGDLGGISEAWSRDPAESRPWRAVAMPHCFNARDAVDPDTHYYQGPGWYRLLLAADNPYLHGRTLLRFEGAGQKTQVYVYERKIAEHVGGYDEFTVDLTDAIAAFRAHPPANAARFHGKIPIAVRCDNSPDLQMIPSQRSDFTIYGGLYRYVDLLYVPAVSLAQVHVLATPDQSGGAQVTVGGLLLNPRGETAAQTLALTILAPDGATVARRTATLAPWRGERGLFTVALPKAERWSPDHPALYRCEVTLTGDGGAPQQASAHFGVRSFKFVDHGPFLLNGHRLLLRGTQRHEDQAGVGAAETEDMIRREFHLMKAMGVNFVRLAHYQQSRLVLQQCDELGILVWEEIPWCRGGVGGGRYQQQARDMLADMINQHYNHPAVIIWSLGNENDWLGDFDTPHQQEAVRAFMIELNALAHRLDPSRKTAIRRCDFCKDIVDVYSPSIWAGWYRGKYIDYKEVSRRDFAQVKHFLHAEWGGDSHARRHAEDPYRALSGVKDGDADERAGDYLMKGGDPRVSRDGDWSETYICDLFDWTLKEQETMPWLTGAAQWIFKDFATPVRPDNPIPYVNEKGLLERDMTPKEGYYVFQSYWTTQPMAHIYGHTWPVRWGRAGQRRIVKVYSNCATAELLLNGVSCGVRTRDSQNFPAAGLRWEVALRAGENRVKVVARAKDGAVVTDEVAWDYETRQWGAPAKLVVREIVRTGDTATVQVLEEDAAGVICLDSRDVVRFGLAGDGRLLDDLGTDTGSRVVQLYNGRALISVQLNHGVSVVSVAAKGVPTGFATLEPGR